MIDPFWNGRNVLVTGATGLLGSWLVPALVHRGARVVVLVRDGSPRSLLVGAGWLDRVASVRGSVTDPGLMRRIVAEYECETVFHLAAQTLVGTAKQDPAGTLESNVCGTWNVLEAARTLRHCQVLLASSDKAYGAAENLPYREDQPLQGRYPYDVSKSCADLIGSMYAATFGAPVGIARCANLFGGGDLNFSRIIPGALMATLRGEPFVIRSDGRAVRDYLYVEDAVCGYLALAEALARDGSLSGQAFNFSMEVRHTVMEIVRMILRVLERPDLEPVVLATASSEIHDQYLSAEKARRILGWSPRHGMAEALERTAAWYEEFAEHFTQRNASPRAAVI